MFKLHTKPVLISFPSSDLLEGVNLSPKTAEEEIKNLSFFAYSKSSGGTMQIDVGQKILDIGFRSSADVSEAF